MKMNKTGFTLIELLAVIIILAIIALIATPIIMNVINNAQEGADLRSVEAYGKELESVYYQYQIANPTADMSSIRANLKTTLDDQVKVSGNQVSCETEFIGDLTEGSTTTKDVLQLTGCKVNGTRPSSGSYKYDSKNGASKVSA